MKFKDFQIDLPNHDCDVTIRFPGGKELVVQVRPSNGDIDYNGSLDIILPDNTVVTNWVGEDMEAAPVGNGCREHERFARQLVMELPGDYELVDILPISERSE